MTRRPDVCIGRRWPTYQFAVFVGPVFTTFAWLPTRFWYGRWVWLRRIERRRAIKKDFLPGPDSEFFCYSDVSSKERGK